MHNYNAALQGSDVQHVQRIRCHVLLFITAAFQLMSVVGRDIIVSSSFYTFPFSAELESEAPQETFEFCENINGTVATAMALLLESGGDVKVAWWI